MPPATAGTSAWPPGPARPHFAAHRPAADAGVSAHRERLDAPIALEPDLSIQLQGTLRGERAAIHLLVEVDRADRGAYNTGKDSARRRAELLVLVLGGRALSTGGDARCTIETRAAPVS
jgi:hypothetical protein